MPAIYTHLRFGEEVAKTLPKPFTALIKKYVDAFHLGTQGPDVLFYHRPLKKKKNDVRKLALPVHALSGNQVFLQQGEKLLKNSQADSTETFLEENGAFAAYTCGFLCHFTLDVLCHPYVDEHSDETLSHGKIESELDKYMLRQDGKPIRGYNTATPIVESNGAKEAAASTFDLPQETLALCIKTMRKINGWFSQKCEGFHGFAHCVLKIAKLDRQFGDMFLHKQDDPLCEAHNRTLKEKFLGAIPKAATLIEEYFTHLKDWVKNKKLKNELFRYDFSGLIKEEM